MHAQRQPSVSTRRIRHIADPVARWELQRANRHDPFSRQVAGNVIRYLPLPQAPAVPRPGEDGEPQVMSNRAFNIGLALLIAGALLVTGIHKAGLL